MHELYSKKDRMKNKKSLKIYKKMTKKKCEKKKHLGERNINNGWEEIIK